MPNEQEATSGLQVSVAAEQIVNGVRSTSYEHGIVADPATGTYLTDCSGFVSYVLDQIAAVHYAAIPRASGRAYPQADEYFAYFASQSPGSSTGWNQIQSFSDVAAGDIVAWRLNAITAEGDTGHVFIVAEAPTLVAEGVWAVRAYDSADLPHFNDSRETTGTFNSGVGTGTVLVHVDAAESPVGFVFGPGDSFHEVPIAVGRLTKLSA